MTRRFRLIAPVVPEDALLVSVVEALDLLLMPPGLFASYPAGRILYRNLYGFELKRDGGKVSRARIARPRRGAPHIVEGQVDIFPRLIVAGMQIVICETLDNILDVLWKWNIPLRGHA